MDELTETDEQRAARGETYCTIELEHSTVRTESRKTR